MRDLLLQVQRRAGAKPTTTAPSYAPLQSVPENRVYVSTDKADDFVRSFLEFSHGRVASDDTHAPGVEIGRSGDTYRRVRIESQFGKLTAFITDEHLPYPYGREMTGYEVANLGDTLAKAKAAGVETLVAPFTADQRTSAIVQFPGATLLRSTRSPVNQTDVLSRYGYLLCDFSPWR